MGLSGEDRRRIYEEERVREDAPGEIERESKRREQTQVSLGSVGIIGLVLAVGLPAILIGCNGESTPQTTAETAPVPESNLFDDAQAKARGEYSAQGAPQKILEFVTLKGTASERGRLRRRDTRRFV